MNTTTLVYVLMVAYIAVTFIGNLIQALREDARLTKEGKTPLRWQNLTTLGVMTLSQLLITWIVVMVTSAFTTIDSYLSAGFLFVVMYYFANITAYLSGYGLVTLIAKTEHRKMQKENPNSFTEGL